jgi:hypothetical protein
LRREETFSDALLDRAAAASAAMFFGRLDIPNPPKAQRPKLPLFEYSNASRHLHQRGSPSAIVVFMNEAAGQIDNARVATVNTADPHTFSVMQFLSARAIRRD